jgi:hypothetical protein
MVRLIPDLNRLERHSDSYVCRPMRRARFSHSMFVHPGNVHEIWVLGGRRGRDGTPTRSVEIYDTRRNCWRSGPRLRRPRIAPAVRVLESGEMVVVGGDVRRRRPVPTSSSTRNDHSDSASSGDDPTGFVHESASSQDDSNNHEEEEEEAAEEATKGAREGDNNDNNHEERKSQTKNGNKAVPWLSGTMEVLNLAKGGVWELVKNVCVPARCEVCVAVTTTTTTRADARVSE